MAMPEKGWFIRVITFGECTGATRFISLLGLCCRAAQMTEYQFETVAKVGQRQRAKVTLIGSSEFSGPLP